MLTNNKFTGWQNEQARQMDILKKKMKCNRIEVNVHVWFSSP